ncbi:hypothetical protein CRUP_038820 [Coryphaenoides rupestris]|nr:hypothetical protein CRUP_038820 [Coryphaenoides rupestris]
MGHSHQDDWTPYRYSCRQAQPRAQMKAQQKTQMSSVGVSGNAHVRAGPVLASHSQPVTGRRKREEEEEKKDERTGMKKESSQLRHAPGNVGFSVCGGEAVEVMQESPGAAGVDGIYASNVPAFLTKLWTLVEDPDTNHLICWSATGTSFHVFDQGRFAKEVLPKYFKHNNMASFVRQLNMYGFRKVVNIEQSGLVKPERDDTEFQHLTTFTTEDCSDHPKEEVGVSGSDIRIRFMKTTLMSQCCSNLIQFLFSQMQPNSPSSVGLKRKLPLMLDEGTPSPPASKFSHSHSMEALQEPFYIQSGSEELGWWAEEEEQQQQVEEEEQEEEGLWVQTTLCKMCHPHQSPYQRKQRRFSRCK